MTSNPEARAKAGPSLGTLLDVLIPVLLLGALFPFLHPKVNLPIWDEFILLCEGTRVLDGQAAGADYFTFLPSGNGIFFAALFSLFGKSLTAARAATFLAVLLTATGLRRLAGHLKADPVSAWSTGLFLPAVCLPIWPITSHHWIAMSALPWGLFFFLRHHEKDSRGYLAAAWVCLAWSAFWLQTHWVILGAALGAGWLIRRPSALEGLKGGAFVLSSQIPQFVGAAVLAGPGALAEVFYNQWVWIFSGYGQQGGINQQSLASLLSSSAAWVFREEGLAGLLYRANLTLLLWVSLLAPLGMAAWLGLGLRNRAREKAKEPLHSWLKHRLFWIMAATAALAAAYTFMRAKSVIHLSQYALPMVAGLWLLACTRKGNPWPGRVLLAVALYNLSFWCLPVYTSGFRAAHLQQSRAVLETYPPWQAISTSPYRSLEEPILVLPEGAQFQFMGFKNPTPFNLIFEEHHAYYTGRQKAMLVESLQAAPPAAIILYPKSRASGFLNASTGTGQFIASRYRKAGENQYLVVYERLPDSAAGEAGNQP